MLNHAGDIILGAMLTAFFALLWRHMDAIQKGTDTRFTGVEKRFDGIEKRFDGIDQRFNRIDKRLDGIDSTLVQVQKDMTQFYGITQKLEGRIDEISQRVK